MGLERLKRLQGLMQDKNIVAALIMHPRDVFYYAGTAQPCNLVIPARGEPCLLIRRAEDCVRRETWVENLLVGGSLSHVKGVLTDLGITGGQLGVTEDNLPAAIYKKIAGTLAPLQPVNLSPLLLEQRMVKDAGEIRALRATANAFAAAHHTIMAQARPGVKEIELAGMVYSALRNLECEGISRNRRWDASLHSEGIICAGENTWQIAGHAMTITGVGLSNSLAWGPSAREMQKGEVLIIDMGFNRHGYHADISRTYVLGRATARQKEVFRAVKAIQDRVLALIRPNVAARDLYEESEKAAWETGYHDYFQGFGKMKGHYIGHGLGLELDEPPTIDPHTDIILQENMVLAIEPKLIIPDLGGFVLEDTLLVTADGYELLSTVPRTLFEIELT